ncbi:hypothetical protein M8J76_015958 [Diaphorina citri]|nr:hypothetical protein M8J76_015958 [Diaphorina citri]
MFRNSDASLVLLLVVLQTSSILCIIMGNLCQSDESFNHIVLIRTSRSKHCTGALISSSWIVTSASCFATNGQDTVDPAKVLVQAGTLTDLVSTLRPPHLTRNVTNLKRRRRFVDFIDGDEYEKIKALERISYTSRPIKRTTRSGVRTGKYGLDMTRGNMDTTRGSMGVTSRKYMDVKKFSLKVINGSVDVKNGSMNVTSGNMDVLNGSVQVNGGAANVSTADGYDSLDKEVAAYVRKVVQIHLCPHHNQAASLSDQCDLALLQVHQPYTRSRRISWIPIGNGVPRETPFNAHLCGWGQTSPNERGRKESGVPNGDNKGGDGKKVQDVVKNFVLDVQILPPAQCPPARRGTRRRLIGVGHGSEPILPYRRKRNDIGGKRNDIGGRCDPNGKRDIDFRGERQNGENNGKWDKDDSERKWYKEKRDDNNDVRKCSGKWDINGSERKWDSNENGTFGRQRRYVLNDPLFSCGNTERYYVFTNLCYHLDWIYQVIPSLSKSRNSCAYVT